MRWEYAAPLFSALALAVCALVLDRVFTRRRAKADRRDRDRETAKLNARIDEIRTARDEWREIADNAVKERERVLGLHAERIRVGHFSADPLEITARLRKVEASLRAEYDGRHIVVYGKHRLTPEQRNAVAASMAFTMDGT